MNTEQPSESTLEVLAKIVKEVSSLSIGLIGYFVALFGLADVEYAKTLSVVTLVLTTVFLAQWRWRRIAEKKEKKGKATKRKTKALDYFLNPLRGVNADLYRLPLLQRRVEAGVLGVLSLFTLVWAGIRLPAVVSEWSTDKEFVCNDYETEGKLRIVLADLDEGTQDSTLNIPDRIAETLAEYPSGEFYSICRLHQPVTSGLEAPQVAETYEADMLIWGRIDTAGYDLHLEVPKLGSPQENLPVISMDEATTTEFQSKEAKHISYVSQFALTELLLLNGQVSDAQLYLSAALDQAELDTLDSQYLADGYFLLGLFFDPNYSSVPNQERSVEAYTKALAFNKDLDKARLNRAYGYTNLGMNTEARDDLDYLIQYGEPFYKCTAYINRADLQIDPDARMGDLGEAIKCNPQQGYLYRGLEWMNRHEYQLAIRDLNKAVEYDRGSWYNYHYLALAQLTHGDYEDALATYKGMLPYLPDQETRDDVIEDIKNFQETFPNSKPTCEEIITTLLAAPLP